MKNDALVQIHCLQQYAMDHQATNHPYLITLANGEYPDPMEALKDFSIQYQGYTAWFPKYLTAAMSKLEQHQHRLWLIENLSEESGILEDEEIKMLEKIGIKKEWVQGVPHPELFQRFQQALNVNLDSDLCDAVHVWRELFYTMISNGSAAEAIGAIGLGTESIVKYMYRHLTNAIQKHTSLTKEDYVFFELHSEIDDEHGALMLQIAVDLLKENPDNYFEIKKGMLKALNLRAMFWENMHNRAKTLQYELQDQYQGAI